MPQQTMNTPTTRRATTTRRRVSTSTVTTTFMLLSMCTTTQAFAPQHPSLAPRATPTTTTTTTTRRAIVTPFHHNSIVLEATKNSDSSSFVSSVSNKMAHILLAGMLTASVLFPTSAALAENELSAKYGGGLDTSLVDQTCLVDQCSLQAKACLADDPSCRKGLTCTAKCLGDNACITGCMARYGNENLDNLLKCTIEDHECIKVAILPGGADEFGQEPRSPAPTIPNFNVNSMQGNWYKVVGYNPNYDCYACQRNSFAVPSSSSSNNNELSMNVEFSMPHLLPDGSPPPPSGVRETLVASAAPTDFLTGSQSIGLNDYSTHETMIFDKLSSSLEHPLVMKSSSSSQQQLVSYARTAHSEGEMFGLKFWENWYIIGENDASSSEEFKFIYYNGKTRQNTYNGAFVYSRTKELGPESLKRVYQIAQQAGMDPKQFCRIQNGCFDQDGNKATPLFVDETTTTTTTIPSNSPFAPNIPFRGILASTKISELLGVEPVAARDTIQEDAGVDYYPTSPLLNPQAALPRLQARASSSSARISSSSQQQPQRSWWYEVGDYLENPHRHFAAMDKLRITMDWPEDVEN